MWLREIVIIRGIKTHPVSLTFVTQTNTAILNILISKQWITNPSSIGDIHSNSASHLYYPELHIQTPGSRHPRTHIFTPGTVAIVCQEAMPNCEDIVTPSHKHFNIPNRTSRRSGRDFIVPKKYLFIVRLVSLNNVFLIITAVSYYTHESAWEFHWATHLYCCN